MKYNTILSLAVVLVAGLQNLFAVTDTCYVAIRIENKVDPFVVKEGPDGSMGGVVAHGLNGDVYLYTNSPIIKMVNESDPNYRNTITGEYRVLTFDCGHAQTYDYVRQKGVSGRVFAPKGVRNFQNQIYFSDDLQQSEMWFQLENNQNTRRNLQIRAMGGEFGGLDKIAVTVSRAEKGDTLLYFADNSRVDSLVLYPGETVSKVSVSRFSNGVLDHIQYKESLLAGKYTFRNSELESETDLMAARSATLTTADSTLSLEAPGKLSLAYSYMEGDGNAQHDVKSIELVVGVIPVEEGSNAWIWWLLGLLVAGGIGGYYYRRYQLKKSGVIPETDAEKVVRLQKEVATHEATIKSLRDVESGLLSDKDGLQRDVQKLNQALQASKSEILEKEAESNNYHNQLTRLQQHTDEVQSNLNEAKRQIAVYESGEEQKEIKHLNEVITNLKEEQKAALAAAEEKKQREMAALVASNEEKMNDARYECETRITAVTSDKENAVAAMVAEKEAIESRLTSEKAEAIALLTAAKEEVESRLTAEMEEMKTRLTSEKAEAIATLTAVKEETVAAAMADRDAKVAAANAERDEKVSAAMADRDAQVAAAIADRDAKVASAIEDRDNTINRLMIEKDDAINAAVSEKEEAIGIAITEKEAAIVAAHAEKVAAIAAANAEKESAIAAAIQEKENAIAAANKEKEEAIAAAMADKNIAVNAANEERDRAVLAAEEDRDNTVNALTMQQTQELDQERARTAQAEATIRRASAQFIANVERSVDAIVTQVSTMQQEVVDSRYENNYTNVISHLCQKVLDFERWFKREIVLGQEGHIWSVEEVRSMIQEQLIPALSNNYTWVSEMVRFTSYCAISRQFKDQFRKSGVPTDYLLSAYAETVTLFGRMGITLYVPNLFADDFNPEFHKLNNAPLINSFFPHTFMEYKPESKGMIYDVLRPGYSVEGEIKQLPEVCAY